MSLKAFRFLASVSVRMMTIVLEKICSVNRKKLEKKKKNLFFNFSKLYLTWPNLTFYQQHVDRTHPVAIITTEIMTLSCENGSRQYRAHQRSGTGWDLHFRRWPNDDSYSRIDCAARRTCKQQHYYLYSAGAWRLASVPISGLESHSEQSAAVFEIRYHNRMWSFFEVIRSNNFGDLFKTFRDMPNPRKSRL